MLGRVRVTTEQRVGIFNVKPAGTRSNHCALKGYSNKQVSFVLNGLGFNSWQCQEIFPFSKNAHPASFQWVPRLFTGGTAEPVKMTTHLHLMLTVKLSGAVPLRPPMCLHSTGKDIFTFMYTTRANFVYQTLANYDILLRNKTLTLTKLLRKYPSLCAA